MYFYLFCGMWLLFVSLLSENVGVLLGLKVVLKICFVGFVSFMRLWLFCVG